ncbi:MAG TPA: hypothetical protein VGK46_10645 [Saprospiraceae bacterium]
MHHLVRFITGLFAIPFAVGLLGCSLSEPEPSSNEPALILYAEQNLSLTTLSWDRVNVTGFKEYIILQSPNPIPDNPVPELSPGITVLKRIDDLDITSLSVSIPLLSPQICYKLYCAVDDRFFYSPNLCVNPQIDVVNGFFDRGCHEPGNDEAVMFDRFNNHLVLLNYKTGQTSTMVTDFVLNFPTLEMTTLNNVTNVFASDQSPSWLRKYAYPSLTGSNGRQFGNVLWSANVYNQFVFVTTDDFNKGFQVLSRNGLNVLDTREGTIENQNIAVFPGNPITVLTVGLTESTKYLINEEGKVVSSELIPARVVQVDRQHNCDDGNDFFVAGTSGNIINRDGQNVATLNTNVNAVIQLPRFNADQTKLVYLITDNIEIRLEVVDLSNLPTITLLQSLVVPTMSFADVIPDGDIIYLLGTSFNSSFPQSFILKYPFPS